MGDREVKIRGIGQKRLAVCIDFYRKIGYDTEAVSLIYRKV